MDKIKYLLENMFNGNKNKMLLTVSNGLVNAKKVNDLRLVALIEKDLKLIRSL